MISETFHAAHRREMFFSPAFMNNLSIRLCKSWDECVECEELQKQVWEMPDYRDAVPANFLITAIKNGGLLVGAFDGPKMVGFAFGFLGEDNWPGFASRFKHTSHMLGVLSEARGKDLGAQMKWFQREQVLKQGHSLMTWTYDPLQSINAMLNLSHLGAIARRYYRDAYGEMTDALNIGLASDRFEVEWNLISPRVERCAAREIAMPNAAAPAVYQIEWNELGFPVIVDETPLAGDSLRVEIPADINAMKRAALPLAIQWRERTRSTFERAFAAGYAAMGAYRETDAKGRARVYYSLE